MKCTTVSTAIFLLVGVVLNVKAFGIPSSFPSANFSFKGSDGIPLIGSPVASRTSSTDCGSTSGTLPGLLKNQVTQLGCSGPWKKQDVSLSLSTPSSSSGNDLLICVGTSDAQCSNVNNPLNNPQVLSCAHVSTPFDQNLGTCQSENCCVFIVCYNNVFACSGNYYMTYNSTFATTFRDDVLAGIIVGSIVLACCLYLIVYNCCCKNKNKGGDGSQQPIYAPVQNWGGQPQYQQQQQQQYPPQGYGGPPPRGPPPGFQGHQGGYPPQQGYNPQQGEYPQGGYQGQG